MMNSKSEIIRIELRALSGEYLSDYSNYTVYTQYNSQSEAKATDLVKIINSSASYDELINSLPEWFRDCTPPFSREESERLIKNTPREEWDKLPWDLGSWIDAVLNREWCLAGLLHMDNLIQWHLFVYGFPANIETFDYILKASGLTEVKRIQND